MAVKKERISLFWGHPFKQGAFLGVGIGLSEDALAGVPPLNPPSPLFFFLTNAILSPFRKD